MELSVVFLVALALTGATTVNGGPVGKPNELHDIFEEFRALVPRQQAAAIAAEYLQTDAEVQAAVKYVQSPGFRDLVAKTEKIQDVINFYKYLNESGLDIYGSVNKLHQVIGLPPLVPREDASNFKITGGAAGLIADIKAILPIPKIKALYEKKLATSTAFAQLIQRLRSPSLQKLVDALRANKEFQKMLQFAKEAGVDVKAIADLLATMFGLNFPNSRAAAGSSELHDIFEEFRALVPRQQAAAIVAEYLQTDAEVQAAVKYVQSPGFRDLVAKTEKIQDVINFYKYLNESGLDIYGSVNKLHQVIGLPPLVPREDASNFKITGGAAGLIADIKAILPIPKIKALYEKKLATSTAFAQLIQRLRSPSLQKLVDALRANKEFQKMLQFAKEAGVDVKAIADLLATMFGLNFP